MMDRNLGALTAAYQGADNVSSYGMFYQWGPQGSVRAVPHGGGACDDL